MKNMARIKSSALHEVAAHLGRDELEQAVENGLESPQLRQRLLIHLGRSCAVCEERVRDLAESRARQVDPSAISVRDPLLGALLRRLQVLGNGLEPGALRPVHEFWARFQGRPKAFLRLMLEEGRHVNLEGLVEPTVELVEDERRDLEQWSRLEAVGGSPPDAASDLLGLCRVHLADELIHRGDLATAAEQCRRAGEILAKGSAGAVLAGMADARRDLDDDIRRAQDLGNEGLEILATRLEVEAELALARRLPWRALDALQAAERLLAYCTIPGRVAETRVRRASVLLQLEDSRGARDLLIGLQDEIRASGHTRLRLEGVHQLAAAEVQENRYFEAWALLDQNEALYRLSAGEWMLAQREWMLGLIALHLQGFGEVAARHLLRASRDLWRLGSEDEAFQVLDPLIRIYLEQRNAALLDALSPQIEGLLGSERWSQPMERNLRRTLRRAEKLGLDLPSLKILLGWEPPSGSVH